MLRTRHLLLCITLTLALRGFAQDAYIYMTLHNLGCRQSNDTYLGAIPNLSFDEGDLVQVILVGPNGQMDSPLLNGLPGGDDQLAVNPGLPFAMNPTSFTQTANTFYSPEAILIQSAGNGAEPALHPGSKFYVRAWNGPSPATSTRYYNSLTLTQDYPIGLEACGVDSAVRTIRNPLSFPALITYAVTFDGGHTFAGIPLEPQVVFAFDSAQSRLMWHPIPQITSYRVEYSGSLIPWTVLGTTPDTLFPIAIEPQPNISRFFRVIAIQ